MHYFVSSRMISASDIPQAMRDGESLPPVYPQDFFCHPSATKSWSQSIPARTQFVLSTLHTSNGELVGMALFGVFYRRLVRYIPVKTLTLLRSGCSTSDQWWPEYVQPRCLPEHRHQVSWWFLQTARQQKACQWETEVVPVEWLKDWLSSSTTDTRLLVENPEGGGNIPLKRPLSFNRTVQRQCRQTEQFARQCWGGELSLHEEVGAEKWSTIEECKQWHIDKWQGTQTPSGFLNHQFSDVIRRLSDEHPGFRVFRILAGRQTVGMQIILQSNGWAGFYLASLCPQSSNHWRVGIWAHTALARSLVQEGLDVYDFMAGDAPYKQQLSMEASQFARGVWVDIASWTGKLVYQLRRHHLSPKERDCTAHLDFGRN